MDKDIIILLLQTVQLPIVILLVVTTVKAFIGDNINNKSKTIILKLYSLLKSRNSRFLALAFLSNFFYLLLNIITNSKIPFGVSSNFIVANDLLTSILFILYINDFVSKYYMDAIKKNQIIKNILLILYILLGIFIGIQECLKEINSFGPAYNIYNFIVYTCVTLTILPQLKKHSKYKINLFSNGYVGVGFAIWAILQLLGLVELLYDKADGIENVDLLGFFLSLVSKSLILVGFYSYKNHTLSSAILAKEQINTKLIDKHKALESLISKLNMISDCNTLKEISGLLINDLVVEKGIFNFDYIIISELDYYNDQIKYLDSRSTHKTIRDLAKWIPDGAIGFDSQDIMIETIHSSQVIHCHKNEINGIECDNRDIRLNWKIYQKYGHENLERIFIPINLEKTKYKNNISLLIEIGIHNISDEQKIWYDKNDELKLYIDGIYQNIEKIRNYNNSNIISHLLMDVNNTTKDDCLDFISEIVKESSGLLRSELTMTYFENNMDKLFVPPYIKSKAHFEKLSNVCKSLDLGKEISTNFGVSIYEKNPTDYPDLRIYGVKLLLNHNSILIKYVFKKINLINNFKRTSISMIYNDVIDKYEEKKFHKSVSSVIDPLDSINESDVGFESIINIFKDYFCSTYISIWVREDVLKFKQKYATKEVENLCKNFGKTLKLKVEYNEKNEFKLINKIDSVTSYPLSEFKKFSTLNNFECFLSLPIKSVNYTFAYINIYFNRNITKLSYEDINFSKIITSRILINLQLNKLITAFKEMTNSFTGNEIKETLSVIVNRAASILAADSVILFKSNTGRIIKYIDATINDTANIDTNKLKFNQSDTKKRVTLAECILKEGNQFFENRKEFDEFCANNLLNLDKESDFWERENNISLAAIKLSNRLGLENKAVGVMFINYKRPIEFNSFLRKIIETFAALAAGSIGIGLIFERNTLNLRRNLKTAGVAILEVMTSGLFHDANKKFNNLFSQYEDLIETVDDINNKRSLKIKDIRPSMEEIRNEILDLDSAFHKIKVLYRPSDELIYEDHNIVELIQEQLNSLESDFSKKFIRPEFNYPTKGHFYINCDKGLIGNAFFNILNNAIYATNERGIISISLTSISEESIEIQIYNNGPKIPDDIKSIIMYPYITNKPGGSGLGLAMTKWTIEEHNGIIAFKSSDSGTTFKIILKKIN